jgi:hypothetical protein
MIARVALAGLFLILTTALAQAEKEYDPDTVNIGDAIDCKLDAPQYMGFSVTLSDEDGGFKKRGWKKQESNNLLLSQYRLPSSIKIAGHETRTIVFSANAVLAVLHVADPSELARQEKIQNSFPGSNKFLGERELINKSEKDQETGWTVTTRITRNISTVSSHPGKTLVGCSYDINVKLPGEE